MHGEADLCGYRYDAEAFAAYVAEMG